MKKIYDINDEYEELKIQESIEMNSYFEENSGEHLEKQVESGITPKWKQLEKQGERKIKEFISATQAFAKNENISENDLVDILAEKILDKSKSINQFLLINLMWEMGKSENSFSLNTLEKLIRKLLENDPLEQPGDYYMESYIDIWNYDSDIPIPADILEKIILLKVNSDNSYGALIKASTYLSDHP